MNNRKLTKKEEEEIWREEGIINSIRTALIFCEGKPTRSKIQKETNLTDEQMNKYYKQAYIDYKMEGIQNIYAYDEMQEFKDER